MTPSETTPEWPVTVGADRVGSAPLEITVEADAPVREGLARRFHILGIDALSATVTLRRLTDGDIAAQARLRARLTQACVVSLEPVEETVDESVEGRFTARPLPEDDGETVIEPDDITDEPEPIVDGRLALGEWLAQNLSLAMDPFPRASDAVLEAAPDAEAEPEEPRPSPFAGLAALGRSGPEEDGGQ